MATGNTAQRAPQPSDIETARVLLHSGGVARALQVACFYPVALCMWTWEKRCGGEFGLPPRLRPRN